MVRYIKKASAGGDDGSPRSITHDVEALLQQVRERGDQAVRELSNRFDRFDRASYRLTEAEIAACVNGLSVRERQDIDFAQEQVRRFAQAQRASIRDIEVETLPGVVLGHRNIPIQNVGCYVPGGKYPLLASAHMTVLTAKVAGCKRLITCAPPFGGRISQKIVAAQALAGADEIYALGGVQAIAARSSCASRMRRWPSRPTGSRVSMSRS